MKSKVQCPMSKVQSPRSAWQQSVEVSNYRRYSYSRLRRQTLDIPDFGLETIGLLLGETDHEQQRAER